MEADRPAYARAYAPLRVEPPTAGTLKFAATCRECLHQGFFYGVGR